MTFLNERQLTTLVWIPRVSGLLSIIGSLCLIHLLKSRLDSSYKRLLLGLSLADILSSAWYAVGAFPVPADSGLPEAYGNRATCSAQGFFFLFALDSSLFYNCAIMVYFYFTICAGMPPEKFTKRIEPFAHAFALLVPLTFAVVGLCQELYNWSGGLRCGISAYPLGCDQIEEMQCTRGENAAIFRWVFINVPSYLAVMIFYMCVLRVYWSFRGTSRNSQRFSMTSATANTERQVAMQCILYGLVFVNTSIWFVILSIIQAIIQATNNLSVKHKLFPLLVLMNLFYPMQGFFNLLLYVRPRYLQMRSANPTQSRVWAAYEVVRRPRDDIAKSSRSLRRISTQTHQPSSNFLAAAPTQNEETAAGIIGRTEDGDTKVVHESTEQSTESEEA